eukprot:9792674-Alexandrium_andersonii.AAC.1
MREPRKGRPDRRKRSQTSPRRHANSPPPPAPSTQPDPQLVKPFAPEHRWHFKGPIPKFVTDGGRSVIRGSTR